jgi:hypothetical protein
MSAVAIVTTGPSQASRGAGEHGACQIGEHQPQQAVPTGRQSGRDKTREGSEATATGICCADLRPHADFGQSASEKEAQMRKFHDLIGQRFGRLTVLERAPNDKDGSVCWRCICECGTKKEIRGSALIYGDTRSCGCLNDAEHRSHRATILVRGTGIPAASIFGNQ